MEVTRAKVFECKQLSFLEIKINKVQKYCKSSTSEGCITSMTQPGTADQQPAVPGRLDRDKPRLFPYNYTQSQPPGCKEWHSYLLWQRSTLPHTLLNLYSSVSPFACGAAASKSSCFWCSVSLSKEDSLHIEGLQDPRRRQQGREISVPC